MKVKSYVFHCSKCMVMVYKDARDGMVFCPRRPKANDKAFLAKARTLMVNFPDYKCDRNYPQRAVNLPGEPMVSSYKDYQKRLAASGQTEVGVSNRSRDANRRRKKKGMRTEFRGMHT